MYNFKTSVLYKKLLTIKSYNYDSYYCIFLFVHWKVLFYHLITPINRGQKCSAIIFYTKLSAKWPVTLFWPFRIFGNIVQKQPFNWLVCHSQMILILIISEVNFLFYNFVHHKLSDPLSVILYFMYNCNFSNRKTLHCSF